MAERTPDPDELASDWRVSIEVEHQEPEPDPPPAADPAATTSNFILEVMRPDPLVLARVLRKGWTVRQSDWWRFEFSGTGDAVPLVRRWRALVTLTQFAFERSEPDHDLRDSRRWIALHYLARTAPTQVQVQSCRGDEPEDAPPPVRRLDSLDRAKTAAVLSRDLHLRDVRFVRDTLNRFAEFLDRINSLPDESLTRQAVDSALGHSLQGSRTDRPDAT